jgi:5S rRNA maturation endonuclease (ribonuclease M5)
MQRTIVAEYDYVDEAGALLFQCVRYQPKDFRQRRPDGRGGWLWKLDKTRRVLYQLPKVIAAVKANETIYIVEGEKDVQALQRAGVVATTNPMGAGKWKGQYATALKGASVRVIADSDDPGLKHAREVVKSLTGTAANVELFACPKGRHDISDHLAAGGKLDELEALQAQAQRERGNLSDLFVEDILKKHPDLDEDQVRSAKTLGDLEKLIGGGGSAATQIVNEILDAGTVLFHDDGDRCYATFERDGHLETWPIRSQGFELWVRWLMWTATGKDVGDDQREEDGDPEAADVPSERSGSASSATALRDAIAQLQAQAVFDGEEAEVHTRIAFTDSAVYIDLGDPDWRCVHITKDGWNVLDEHPVRFRRAKGIKPLPEPAVGGSLDLLRGFINVATDDDWYLLVAWIVNTVREGRPFPVLNFHGEHGAAKTTATRVARAVIDPVAAPDVRATPRSVDDLLIAAQGSWVVAYDNLSHLEPWLSDALCRLATGGGIGKRQLYTDDDEITLAAKRPVIINAISEVITRADLLDRALNVELPPIPEEDRVDEETFWDGFDDAHASIFGGLCTVIAGALANYSTVDLPKMPRMADFAKWVTAAEPALGWEPDSFLNAYEQNRSMADETAVEDVLIGPHLREIAKDGFEGTFGELLQELNGAVEEKVTKGREWPKSPRKLTAELARLAPNLRKLGVQVEKTSDPHAHQTIIRLTIAPSG